MASSIDTGPPLRLCRPMISVTFSVPTDFDLLGTEWRRLEAEADGSFFQSWSWTGCALARRFPRPLLLRAVAGGRTLALALFNRQPGLFGDTLWLGESGDPALDTIFVEHNGPLIARDAPSDLPARLFDAMCRRFGRRVVLSGIDSSQAARAFALPGTIYRQHDRPAPYADFAAIRAAGQDYDAAISSNTRYQLRRSQRRYAEAGALTVTPAADAAEAMGFLDAMGVLHQATWQGRGAPGAFANPFFRAFHGELLTRAIPRGEAEMLRITAGDEVLGYLYNFLWRGWALSYQSGFAYPGDDTHRKPGLTCHHLAILRHFAAGGPGYDFLAGAARYKSSLSNAERTLHWLETGPVWRKAALVDMLRRLRDRCRKTRGNDDVSSPD